MVCDERRVYYLTLDIKRTRERRLSRQLSHSFVVERHANEQSADQVLTILQELCDAQSKTILMVTHDPAAANRSQRIVHMDKGRLGRVEELTPPPVASAAAAGADDTPAS